MFKAKAKRESDEIRIGIQCNQCSVWTVAPIEMGSVVKMLWGKFIKTNEFPIEFDGTYLCKNCSPTGGENEEENP